MTSAWKEKAKSNYATRRVPASIKVKKYIITLREMMGYKGEIKRHIFPKKKRKNRTL